MKQSAREKRDYKEIEAEIKGWNDEAFDKFLETVSKAFSLNSTERAAAREEINYYTEKCGWTFEKIRNWYMI